MNFAYNLIIRLYYLGIWLYSPFNSKAKLWLQGRRNLFKRLSDNIDNNEKYIWFHCASLGEFEQGRSLIELIKKQNPEYKILLSFFSPSGYEQKKNYASADIVTYLPLDTPNNANRFLDLCKPVAAYFVKYEFWHNFLRGLHKRSIPAFLVSGILKSDHYLFKWYTKGLRKNLNVFTTFFVQDENTKLVLNKNGFNNCVVSGDTRFDRVSSLSGNKASFIGKQITNENVLVAGSTWHQDEKTLAEAIDGDLSKRLQLVIVPHEVEDQHIQKLLELFSEHHPQLSSELRSGAALTSNCLIVNEVGILSSLYAFASLAYVGGGFGTGIHNTLEPCAFGIPVIFGPNYHKFKEAAQLMSLKSGYSISDHKQLKEIITHMLADKEAREKAGNKAKKYILENVGASQKIYEESIKVLKQ